MLLKEFFVRLGLDADTASFSAGQLAVDGLKFALNAMANVARATFSAFKSSIMETVNKADAIDELSQSAGIGAEALQELAYAGKFSGLSMEDIAGALGKLSRNMNAALDGTNDAAKAFKKLKIPLKDSNGELRASDAVLADIAERFSSMPGSTKKTTLAMDMFGKSGARLIPLLNAGPEGLKKFREEAHRLGIVMDENTIKMGVEAADAFDRFGAAGDGLKKVFAVSVIPFLTRAANAMTAFFSDPGTKSKLKVAIKVIGIAFEVIGKTIWYSYRIVKGFIQLLASANPILTILGFTLLALAAKAMIAGGMINTAGIMAMWGWIQAAAPVLALIAIFAALYLIIDDIMTWIDGGDSVLGDLIGPWDVAVKAIRQMFADMFAWITDRIDDLGKTVKYVKDYFTGGNGEKYADDASRQHFASRERAKENAAKVARGEQVTQTTRGLAGQIPGTIDLANTVKATANATTPGAITPPMAQAANAKQAAKAAPANVTDNRTVTVKMDVNGAQDPKAVAAEVEMKIRQVVGGMLDHAAAVVGQ